MGIAAYNRGTRHLSQDIDMDLYLKGKGPCPAFLKRKPKSDLPEGILRSTFLPEDTLNGTKLMLSFENGWYVPWELVNQLVPPTSTVLACLLETGGRVNVMAWMS